MTSAQREFREQYGRILQVGYIGALVLHVIAFAVWPEYVPKVYQLREKEIKVVELPPDIKVPPPPQEIQRPQVPMEADPSEDVDEETTIAPTSLDVENLPPAPPPPPSQDVRFMAFDTAPEPIYIPKPKYPRLAREAELEGRVIVMVFIDETGRVTHAEVMDTPSPVFNDSALAAARKARFKPAKQRDVPVPCRITIPFVFSFN